MDKLIKELKHELSNILSFWIIQTPDDTNDGFVGRIDYKNRVIKDANKGAVMNTRILWTFSAAYNFDPKPQYLEMAHTAYTYLLTNFWDKENGGLFWEVDQYGKAINSRKQIYAQGFGIYGLSEYYKATGKAEALKYACQLYYLIEKHSYDTQYGGYIEALSNNWQPLTEMRLSNKDANEPKSMNTHLHILEPYTNLYKVWPNADIKQSLVKLIYVFTDKITDQQKGVFNLFFGMNWEIKSSTISYGHNIEGAWLLRKAAEAINDVSLQESMNKLALKLVDTCMKEGADTDFSVYYERKNNCLDTDKHWWVQAEAMVGLFDAWQITNNCEYLVKMKGIWSFILNYLVDRQHGEWYWSVDKEGNLNTTEDKAGFWKCPYHNSRAIMELLKRLEYTNIQAIKPQMINY